MKAEHMGINIEKNKHDPAFTWAEATMMGIMANHIGKDDKISAGDLLLRFKDEIFFAYGANDNDRPNIRLRDMRYLVNHLIIDHDQAIMSKAGLRGGYWIAGSKEEMDEFYDTFRKRAMTGLTKAARGKKAVMVSIVKQLAFEFDELKATRKPALVKPYGYESAPVAVVTAFLDKMTKEPEKFDEEIRLLREKFGKVLMPQETFVKIQSLSEELTALLSKVT